MIDEVLDANEITFEDNFNDTNKEIKLDTSANNYLRDINQYTMMSDEENEKIAKMLLDPKTVKYAREQLVTRNLRLVVYVAKRFAFTEEDLKDCIQEGNIGLMHAAELYNPGMGTKFSTYAVYWISQKIARYKNTFLDCIDIPDNVNAKMRKFKRLCSENPKITDEELCEKLGIKKNQLNDLRMYMDRTKAVRLDSPIQNGEGDTDATIGDYIASTEESPEDYVIKDDKQSKVREALNTLDDRSKDVIMRRFGFDGIEPQTLQEIAEYYNITRERVRQIEFKALRKLGSPKYALNKV